MAVKGAGSGGRMEAGIVCMCAGVKTSGRRIYEKWGEGASGGRGPGTHLGTRGGDT
jgi:hypothetical protein